MGFKAKMKKSSPKAFNAWVLFVTVLVIALFLLLYSFVFVKNNEEERIAKGFRVIAQIGKNVVEREKGFRTVIKNVEMGAKERLKQKKSNSLENALNYEIQQTNKLLTVTKEDSARGDLILKPIAVKIKESPYIIFVQGDDFFEPLKREDVFDGLVVLAEENKVIYHSFPGDIDIPEFEKLKDFEGGIEGGSLKEIEISNKLYKLFLQPIKLTHGKKWYVGGVIENKTFEVQSGRLKPGVTTPFFIVFAIFLLGIPVLKLFLMSTFEPLDISDVVFTVLSVTLGVIALILLYLFIFQANHDLNGVEKNLSNLAEQVRKEFTKELTDAANQLQTYDSSPPLKGYHLGKGDSFNNVLTNPPVFNVSSLLPGPAINLFSIFNMFHWDYDLFKVLFWIDGAGDQVLQFSTRKYGGRLINVGNRKYFQEAGNWQLPGNPNIRFMLQSITSMTSGEKLAAISMNSELILKRKQDPEDIEPTPIKPAVKVAAMTTQPISLIDTIMPEGYGFCIIDKKGDVWFHSNTQRNLQENFIYEVENNKELVSAINSSQAKHLNLDYQNIDHKCFVRPIPDIPLYIITFHETKYTSGLHSATIIHTVFFIIALLLFNGLLFSIASWSNYRKSPLKRKFVPFEWFRPSRKKHKNYQHLVLANILIIVFLIVFTIFMPGRGLETFFYCISAVLFSFVYNYHIITGKEQNKYPLNHYRLLAFFLVFLLVVDLLAGWLLDEFILLPVFQAVLFIGLAVLHRFREKSLLLFGQDWGRSYLHCLITWLVLVCVIPVVVFFIRAYNYESEVTLRHVQAKLAEQIEDRNLNIDTFYNEKIDQPDHPVVAQMKEKRKTSGIYANILRDTAICKLEDFKSGQKISDNHFNQIAYFLKPPVNRLAAERRNFVFPEAADKSRVWKKKNNRLYLKYKIKNAVFSKHSKNDDKLYIVSTIKSFKMPTGFSLLLSIIVIVLILVLAYHLVRFSARMIFGLNLLESYKKKQAYIDAQEEIRESVQAGANVILYCPTNKEVEYCSELFCEKPTSKDKFSAYFFDLKSDSQEPGNIIKSKSPKPQTVFIKNFELYAEDIDGNIGKLQKLIDLLRLPHIQVIIPAFMPLPEIIAYYEEKLERMSPGGEESSAAEEVILKYKNIIDLLNDASNDLVPLYLPLKTSEPIYPEIEKIEEDWIKDLIKKEFSAAEYFNSLDQGIYQYYKRLKENQESISEEKIILKIQDLARHYYVKLKGSCSRREVYILYDIAQDMLVNAGDIETINRLLKKGLIVYDGTFRLMNESFRNYILSSVDIEGLELYVNTLSPKWRSYKTPVLLIALGVAVFFMFQEDWLGKVDAIVTTAIGGIAIITKFSGLFLKFSQSGSK